MSESKVFGIGLNKTGTTTLGRALEILGYEDHMSHSLALTEEWSNGDMEPILNVAKVYNNFEDWPWPLVYRELYGNFDNAKFILTKRKSQEVWYKSLCDHSLRTGPTKYRKLVYGFYMPHNFKSEHIEFYQRHNKSVINFFHKHAPKKLLVVHWEKRDGWKKLCRFLGKDIPKRDFPFLNRNPKRSWTYKKRIKNRIKKIL